MICLCPLLVLPPKHCARSLILCILVPAARAPHLYDGTCEPIVCRLLSTQYVGDVRVPNRVLRCGSRPRASDRAHLSNMSLRGYPSNTNTIRALSGYKQGVYLGNGGLILYCDLLTDLCPHHPRLRPQANCLIQSPWSRSHLSAS